MRLTSPPKLPCPKCREKSLIYSREKRYYFCYKCKYSRGERRDMDEKKDGKEERGENEFL